jgi:deoxyribodipyrimidine photo-lyase
MKRKVINVFLHRRDLRVTDNTALDKLKTAHPDISTIHIFIFNPLQVDPVQNPYFSKNSVEFMVQSLKELAFSCPLFYFYEKESITVFKHILKYHNINAIAFNKDYTPFAIQRDQAIIDWCANKKIECITSDTDYTLFKLSKDPYKVFTPFYRHCLQIFKDIPPPRAANNNNNDVVNIPTGTVKNIDKFYFNEPNLNLAVKGGTAAAEKILIRIDKGEFTNYVKTRDFPALDKTTKLSAYIKYGCVSIRQVFWRIYRRHGINHGLLRELFWREFYANITYAYPRVLQGKAFREKYDAIDWKYNEEWWQAFDKGCTGYPFVDAGIRQLKTTGWCHNRLRMVIAMFASKDLHLPPVDIERWFAQHLIDYDPSSNSGGVQWAYGIGSDAQPYFRIFNPMLQGTRYDPNALYIKKYLPELKNISSQDIHKWDTVCLYHKTNYKCPIINHSTQAKRIKTIFKNV